MSYEQSNTESEKMPPSDQARPESSTSNREATHDSSGAQAATVIVRGEAVNNSSAAPKNAPPATSAPKPVEKQVSPAKLELKNDLPKLADDSEVGVKKDQIVTRDDKADLAFSGTLIASAAPSTAPKGSWKEYRVYETSSGKHVFSKVGRSVYADEHDSHEAEVFDPAPTSVPSQLLRSARDLTRSKPLNWTDAAADYFGYDPLAKSLYRKLSGDFEEHIT